MDEQEQAIKLKRYGALCRVRALHETVVVNLEKIHGAVLTGLGNEAAPVGVLLSMMEMMTPKDFLLSPKCGDQRAQMALAAVTDFAVESEHDHSYAMLYNHLQRRGVEDGNVHWGCLEHGIWPFFTSDMMRPFSIVAGGAWEMRRYLENPVGVYFFGEGASSQGVAHEVMTWLSAQNYSRSPEQLLKYNGMPLSERAIKTGVLRPVPMIACLQVNRLSIYTDEIDEHGGRAAYIPGRPLNSRGELSRFARWALSYGAVGVDVNGDNLEEVIQAGKEAISRAQKGVPEPTLLVLHMEMRRTAHNEHMIDRPPEARKNRDWSKGTILGVDSEAFKKAWENEPLALYQKYLADLEVASELELVAMLEKERNMMDERWQKALKEPPVTFEDSVKKRERKHFMFAPHDWSLTHRERSKEEMLNGGVTTNQALLDVISEFMREDEGVVYSGEDVGSGGVLVRTRVLQKEFGPERVFDTPIAEEAIYGTTAGASLARWILREHGIVKTAGTHFCEAQFMPFNADGEVLMRSIAPNWYQKKMPFHFVAIEHSGVVHGGGSGHYHSDCVESHYLNMPGIAVVCASDAFDLVGLMRSAYESEWPVVFMIPTWSYNEQECAAEIPNEKYLIPIGKAAVKRDGKDITVITYGTCVRAALREAEFLAKDGIELEVIDLRSLQPLDMETIATSIKKTGRVVVMAEASPPVAEMMSGRITSNPKLCDALARTRKPQQEDGEGIEAFQERVKIWVENSASLFREFSRYDVDAYRRTPRIALLSRDWSPIASAKDIEWGDLPFEEYQTETLNARGEKSFHKHVRSVRLSAIAHDLMRY